MKLLKTVGLVSVPLTILLNWGLLPLAPNTLTLAPNILPLAHYTTPPFTVPLAPNILPLAHYTTPPFTVLLAPNTLPLVHNTSPPIAIPRAPNTLPPNPLPLASLVCLPTSRKIGVFTMTKDQTLVKVLLM